MDANGLKFWLLAQEQDWFRLGNPPATHYSNDRRTLQLARQRLPRWRLTVLNPDGAQSNPLYFGLALAAPLQVTRLSPAHPQVSVENQPIVLMGEGLTPDLTVAITLANGQTTVLTGLESDSTSPPQVSFELALPIAGPAKLSITLPNGDQSPPYFFTVLPASLPALAITDLMPSLPNLTQTLEVAGRGFRPDDQIRVTLPGGREVDLEASDLEVLDNNRLRFNLALAHLESETEAILRRNAVPPARDLFGTTARWVPENRQVLATGVAPDVPIYPAAEPLPDGIEVNDLAMGHDGVLYLAIDGGVTLQDQRQRWPNVTLTGAVPAWRLAPAPGGVWIIDAPQTGAGMLMRLTGQPLPQRPGSGYTAETFRPCDENPHPPRIETVWSGGFTGETMIAIAASPQGRLALLTWVTDADARLRWLQPDNTWTTPITLTGCRFPYALTWASETRIALMLTGMATEAPVFEVSAEPPTDAQVVYPLGEFYPLRNATGEAFYQGLTLPAHYPTRQTPQPLIPLSLPTFAPLGEAWGKRPWDSGSSQTVWHRLYLEAVIPASTTIRVFLGTSDAEETPPDAWFEHCFGVSPGVSHTTAAPNLPSGTWLSQPSEIPHQSGLLPCSIEPGRAGLFTVLIQRSGRKVSALRGRYLWVRVQLSGAGQSTPEIAALRAYGSRFSYRDRYLPKLYGETVFGRAADAAEQSTPADFLERFLTLFESVLTPIEDRIARADLLTTPQTVPEDALEWLGSWIGVSFDSGYPQHQRRRLLQEAATLYPKRGTLKGLTQALDIATDNGVRSGEIVVLEDFRLRRTFATILGADLADETDPLLQGLAVSGNSYIGDTLFLGDDTRPEFLALFGPDLPDPTEEDAIIDFFDTLAFRVTILVHQSVTPQSLSLIRRIVDQETPAHVLPRIATASSPLIVGLAALVGVDTYLTPKPTPRPIRLGQSALGVRDQIIQPPSLDPRLNN